MRGQVVLAQNNYQWVQHESKRWRENSMFLLVMWCDSVTAYAFFPVLCSLHQFFIVTVHLYNTSASCLSMTIPQWRRSWTEAEWCTMWRGGRYHWSTGGRAGRSPAAQRWCQEGAESCSTEMAWCIHHTHTHIHLHPALSSQELHFDGKIFYKNFL